MHTTIIAVAALAAGILIGVLVSDGTPFESVAPATQGGAAGASKAARGFRPEADPGNEAVGVGPSRAPTRAEPATLAAGAPDRRPETFPLDARRAWVLGLVDRSFVDYRNQSVEGLPAALRRATADAALAYVERTLQGFGGWMSSYEEAARLGGTLGDPPTITVQARGSGTVDGTPVAGARRGAHRSVTPLDVASAPVAGEPLQWFVASGVQPLDRVLVLERIDVLYQLGAPDRPRSQGRLDVRVGDQHAYEARGTTRGMRRGVLRGLELVRPPYQLPDVRLTLREGVAELVAHGRYVTLAEAEGLRDRQFHWAPEGDDGLLGPEPVLLQVLADHGGGNDRKVRLDGSTYRVDATKEASLWSDTLDVGQVRGSFAYSENAGTVPDGKIYRITRIAWRTRLDPRNPSHSDFEIRFRGESLVARTAKEEPEHAGVWTGELDLEPGDESRFEVVCSYFGLGEAIVYGELVAKPPP